MSPLVLSLIAFVVILGAGLAGASLPGHQLPEDTRDVVRLGAGLIGTIAGLVLGLLIGSANSSYEAQNNQVQQMTADVILLDNLLGQYGDQTHQARALLRGAIQPFVERVWATRNAEPVGPFRASAEGEAFYFELERLVPQDETQRSIKTRALGVYTDLAQTRVLLQQRALSSIPMPFLVVLVVWLAIIFFSFGLFARHHFSVLIALFVFALSASGALFLILELTHPFTGLMRIPSEPVLNALPPLSD